MKELQTLFNERKWFDFAQKIKNQIKNNSEEDNIENIFKLYKVSVKNMHPITCSEITILLYPFLSYNKVIEIFNESINSIENYNLSQKNSLNELIAVKMHFCLFKIKNNDLKNRESEIIEWKNLFNNEIFNTTNEKLCLKNIEFLNYLAFNFYLSVKNVEESQNYLYNYIITSKDFNFIELLMKLSIISYNFFNFSLISTLPEFKLCKNNELKNLFINFQKGKFSVINENKDNLISFLNEFVNSNKLKEYDSFIIEKVYLINILNTCFITEDKFVSFDKFINDLEIEEDYLIFLLLKALGMKIITGWIDSEKKMLFFDGILPRGLSENDIENMKIKFIHWRNKINKVIETTKLEIK